MLTRSPATTTKNRVVPRRVNWLKNSWDFEVALLAAEGRSTSYIMRVTGLSASQVTYRLHQGVALGMPIARALYRDGGHYTDAGRWVPSPLSRIIHDAARLPLARAIRDHLKKSVDY